MSESNADHEAPQSRSRQRLPPGQQLVARDKWPIIGERSPAQNLPDTLTIRGLVRQHRTWSLFELSELKQTTATMDIHCVTRWSKYDLTFQGVLLRDLLEHVGVDEQAVRFVSFNSHSDRKHSSTLPLFDAIQLQTLIATQVDDRPLECEHGGSIRSVVPGRYFYKSVKWLVEIELLAEDRLGFWEAESGYHNEADPWREQRYMAATLDRRAAGVLIESRDFSRRDLRSIDCSCRMLTGLNAKNALLRDADFRMAKLNGAVFNRANLSNAHFEKADLRSADFTQADLEGANFSGADLRGADFTGSSLFGASFFQIDGMEGTHATLDRTTVIPQDCLMPLTPEQYEFVQRAMAIG
jgi:DMSO/TMAO reductase YedYZ molybdopterin-dependent catalytic subunit